MIRLFKSYFGGNLSVDAIKNNFVLIYELLDEIMDNGVPQVGDQNSIEDTEISNLMFFCLIYCLQVEFLFLTFNSLLTCLFVPNFLLWRFLRHQF